jgi:DNA-binding response OmpR family regulator
VEAEPTLLRVADLTLDPARRLVRRGQEKIELSTKEFAMLDYFMRHPGRVLTRTMIAEHVWDVNFDTFTNVIDVYMSYLRNKIDRAFPDKLIRTVRGRGYVIKG